MLETLLNNLLFAPAKIAETYRNGGTRFGLRINPTIFGCYIIKEDNIIVYVGYSGVSIYNALTRHFQSWEDNRQYRVTYKDRLADHNYEIAAIAVDNKQHAAQLEKELILHLQPRDNRKRYEEYIAEKELPEGSFEPVAVDEYEECPF